MEVTRWVWMMLRLAPWVRLVSLTKGHWPDRAALFLSVYLGRRAGAPTIEAYDEEVDEEAHEEAHSYSIISPGHATVLRHVIKPEVRWLGPLSKK